MENESTNQNFRKMLIRGAFEIMKINQREYSKQSTLYLPQPEKDVNEKTTNKK